MNYELSVYDKSRTTVVQASYYYSAKAEQSGSQYQEYITNHRLGPTNQATWSISVQANVVAEPVTVWSMSCDSFFLGDTIILGRVGHETITSIGQSENLGRYASATIYIYTSEPMLTGQHFLAPIDRFESDEQFFLSIRDELLKDDKYRDKFVAILNGKLIDSDPDEGTLAERCYREHGYRPIYIDKVERIKRIINLPSPQRAQ